MFQTSVLHFYFQRFRWILIHNPLTPFSGTTFPFWSHDFEAMILDYVLFGLQFVDKYADNIDVD